MLVGQQSLTVCKGDVKMWWNLQLYRVGSQLWQTLPNWRFLVILRTDTSICIMVGDDRQSARHTTVHYDLMQMWGADAAPTGHHPLRSNVDVGNKKKYSTNRDIGHLWSMDCMNDYSHSFWVLVGRWWAH